MGQPAKGCLFTGVAILSCIIAVVCFLTNPQESSPQSNVSVTGGADQPKSVSVMFEQTPEEQIEEKMDNAEYVITKTHYQNDDGIWYADGYSYQYRLEIIGKLNQAVNNITYIVLSNNEDITFEQTWKASGLSSLYTDYFKPEDAVIVESGVFQ